MYRSFLPLLCFVCLASTVGCTIELDAPGAATAAGADPEVPGAPENNQPTSSKHIYASKTGWPTDFATAQTDGVLGEGDLTVLMIVDRSGSMSAPWDGSTKWQIVRASLNAAIVGVEKQVTLGALFFPMEEECAVLPFHDPAQIQLQKGELFKQELSEFGDALGSGTPMFAAFLQAHAAIKQAISDGALAGRFRVLLLTDGEPNCTGTEDELVAVADEWRELGAEVRVMGLPGSEQAARLLDRLAGKIVADDAPYVPPPTVIDTGASATDTGYVAPESTGDVDDSLELMVR